MKAIHILTGPNKVFQDQHLEKMLNKFSSEDISSYYGDDTPAAVIFDQCYQNSLFGSQNIVVVRNAGSIKDKSRKEEFLTHFENYLPQYNESTVLIIEWEKIPAKVSKLVKDKGYVEVKEFKTVYKSQEMAQYIRSVLSSHKLEIAETALDLILQLAHQDLEQIAAYTRLLCDYASAGSRLEYQDVKACLSRAHNLSVFDLTDALFRQDLEGALHAVEDLRLDNQSVIAVANMIMRSTRHLWAIVSQPRAEQLYTELSISPYEFKKLKGLASRVNLKYLSRMLSVLSTIEIRSKTGPEEFAWLELECFILSWKGLV